MVISEKELKQIQRRVRTARFAKQVALLAIGFVALAFFTGFDWLSLLF